ncbi:MAG: hypothetical protein DRI91_02315 [Aquificota bacterium]|nr:MAG: hypothetical protein DRI91_02315 [Aquificota bacterium]
MKVRMNMKAKWSLWVIGGLLLFGLGLAEARGAVYTVQIAAVKLANNLPILEKEALEFSQRVDLSVYLVQKDSTYALVVGRFPTQSEGVALKGKISDAYPDAFVTLWKDMKVIQTFKAGSALKEGDVISGEGSPSPEKKESKPEEAKKGEETKRKVSELPKGMYPKNSLVKIRALGSALVLVGEEPWGFVDLEKFSPPLRYVVHLFNTSPAVSLDTLYSPTPGVEKVKVLYDYMDRKTDVVIYPSNVAPLAMEKRGKELVLSLKGLERKVEGEKAGVRPSVPTFEARKKVYTGKRISLEFKNADIRDVIRILSEVSGLNFVVDPDVKGTVTVKLDNVPWDQALDVILRTNKLGKVVEEGIVRIATLKSLAQEGQAQESARKALEKTKPMVLEVIPLNFVEADKVKDLITPLLSDEGKVDYLERINSLVVKDNAERIAKIKEFVKKIDTPTPQIQIGARIVEIVTTYLKELGIQWGFLWRQTKTDMSFPYSFGVGGGVTPAPATSQALTTMEGVSGWSPASIAPGYVVDLPAAVMTGSGGAIAASLLNASETFGLDIRLSALEEEGVARTVSNPKLVTLDNQEAEISQGYEIPFATVSESGTETEFKEAKLKLLVKPHITSSGDIVMDVEVSKDSPDFTHVTPDGVPIQTRSVKTSVRMKNGDTLIIGGIYEMTKSKKNNQVPGLSRIPLLSWLFRHRMENLEKRELLIFVTPTVIEAGMVQGER